MNPSSTTLLLFPISILLLACACKKTVEGGTYTSNDLEKSKASVTVTTIAGKAGDRGNAEDGNGLNARFWNPTKMVFDNRNSTLYVADGTTIRSIDQKNNVKTYLALHILGNYNEIMDIDLAPGVKGGTLYFISKENDLWKIEPNGNGIKTTRIIDRIYGGNATGVLNSSDHIDGPTGVTAVRSGKIYFFNSYWNTMHSITVKSVSPVSGTVSTFAGKPLASRNGTAWPFLDGQGEKSSFGGNVNDICSDSTGNIYVADFRNDLVRIVAPTGLVSSLFSYNNGLGVDKDGNVAVAQANRVTHVTSSTDGKAIYFTTYGKGATYSPALRKVTPGKDVFTLVTSKTTYADGTGTTAGLHTIGGIASTPDGKVIYISEPAKKVIRKVSIP